MSFPLQTGCELVLWIVWKRNIYFRLILEFLVVLHVQKKYTSLQFFLTRPSITCALFTTLFQIWICIFVPKLLLLCLFVWAFVSLIIYAGNLDRIIYDITGFWATRYTVGAFDIYHFIHVSSLSLVYIIKNHQSFFWCININYLLSDTITEDFDRII